MSRLLHIARSSFQLNKVILRKDITRISDTYCGLCKRFTSSRQSSANENFLTIYRFPQVSVISAVLASKKYVKYIGLIGVFVAGYCEFSGITSENVTAAFIFTGLVCTMFLFTVSFAFKNTIGFIYVTPNFKKLKIGYVDFWGKRVDKVIPTEDWIPFSDLPVASTDKICLLPRLYSEEIIFRYFRTGILVDKVKFEKALGDTTFGNKNK